jgi:hypothetical protein
MFLRRMGFMDACPTLAIAQWQPSSPGVDLWAMYAQITDGIHDVTTHFRRSLQLAYDNLVVSASISQLQQATWLDPLSNAAAFE